MIALHPIRAMIGVTQPMNGSTSHVGLKAIDFGWNSKYANSKTLYAPFDGQIVAKIGNTNTIAFQSKDKVEWADGTFDYMTVITAHDNSAPAIGSTFKQGEVYSHMGTATGVACHCHLEVQRGRYQPYTSIKKTGQYNSLIFPNTVEPFKALYVAKGTVLGKSATYDWKYEPESETTDYKSKYEELKAKVESAKINLDRAKEDLS